MKQIITNKFEKPTSPINYPNSSSSSPHLPTSYPQHPPPPLPQLYPQFILEVFPHLRSEVSPLLPNNPSFTSMKSERKVCDGQEMILNLYERDRMKHYENNKMNSQLMPPPLPIHIPIQIEETIPPTMMKQEQEYERKEKKKKQKENLNTPSKKKEIDVIKMYKTRKSLVLK